MGHLPAQVINFVLQGLIFMGFSVWNLLHVIILVPGIFWGVTLTFFGKSVDHHSNSLLLPINNVQNATDGNIAHQGSENYVPRAASDPRFHFIRPANDAFEISRFL